MQHWNDDAVWMQYPELPVAFPPNWSELKYPTGHPWETKSIDMAFVITPEPATILLLGAGWLVVLARKKRTKGLTQAILKR
jgi:hypothetical protein